MVKPPVPELTALFGHDFQMTNSSFLCIKTQVTKVEETKIKKKALRRAYRSRKLKRTGSIGAKKDVV
ncbi:hypothetical protein DPMN_141994 [Dreissena polymorpha]|uniref:Uncharacterized protein n=1 Tax=Dreissena polymorpha TaxID=45954 RepID=A0A9D4GAU0_DREPO|nr:hypothetical protein DPMN_141994 [Dreissena polymorpha]